MRGGLGSGRPRIRLKSRGGAAAPQGTAIINRCICFRGRRPGAFSDVGLCFGFCFLQRARVFLDMCPEESADRRQGLLRDVECGRRLVELGRVQGRGIGWGALAARAFVRTTCFQAGMCISGQQLHGSASACSLFFGRQRAIKSSTRLSTSSA